MSIFKTIGAVVGGVVVGVTTTIVLKDRRTFVAEIENRMANKVKEKAGEAIKDIGEKVVESVSDEDKVKAASKEVKGKNSSSFDAKNDNNASNGADELIDKIEQIEKLVGDVKGILKSANKASVTTSGNEIKNDCKD